MRTPSLSRDRQHLTFLCGPAAAVALRAALLAVVVLVLSASNAHGAVAFRAASAATAATSASTTSLVVPVPRPAGLAVNDIMLAVSRWSGSGGAAVATTWTPAPGWTEIDSNDSTGNSVSSTALWWKRATAADVSAATFTFTAAWAGAKDAIITGGISAFSGAVPTGSPFTWTSAAQVQGNPPQTAMTMPRNAGTFAVGSMSVSLAGIRRVTTTCCTVYTGNTGPVDVSSVGTGTQAFALPVTGNSVAGLNAFAAYRAANATGQWPTATTATLSAQSNWSAWTLIIEPAPPCGTGGLNLSEPSSISFGSTALNGLNQTVTTSTAITVDDQTSSGAGWNLTINPTPFSNGSAQLPATAVAVTGAAHSDAGGRCSAPTNSVVYSPLVLPTGSATKVYNAAAGTGQGPSIITLDLALTVPGNAKIGAYSAAWTVTLSSAP